MSVKTRIIFAAPPEYIPVLREKGCVAAYMIYRIGRGFKLYRSRLTMGVEGGVMVLDTGGFKGGGPLSALITEIMLECNRMKYTGIVIDDGGSNNSTLQRSLCKGIATGAYERKLDCFVPESLAGASDHTIVRISTALSGGTLRRHLADAVERYGLERIALEIERIRMDFTLPAVNGLGKPLSEGELQKLAARHGMVSSYSVDLAVNYFTYNEKNKTHFVLHDDASSIRRKLSIANGMGIKNVFMFYPHVNDIYDEIIA